jgi:hypothetical protein
VWCFIRIDDYRGPLRPGVKAQCGGSDSSAEQTNPADDSIDDGDINNPGVTDPINPIYDNASPLKVSNLRTLATSEIPLTVFYNKVDGVTVWKVASQGTCPAQGGRNMTPIFAVGRERTMKPGQVHPWLGHPRHQLGDDKLAGKLICTTRVARRVEHKDVRHEIQRLKDDVRGPIAVRRFELGRSCASIPPRHL